MLYPLKFNPLFFEKVWGGNRLNKLLKKNFAGIKNCGESWEISGLKNKSTMIQNGFLTGNHLDEIVEVYMEDIVGEQVFANFGVEFPLLIKYIDTNDHLSLQVHPYNNFKHNNTVYPGKEELWYIINAEQNSEIIVGFKEEVNKEIFLKHLENKTLKNILNVERPKAGDVFHIKPGTIHSIGAGITLLEIQQASDSTFRVYDWDRPGLDGKPRDLHIDLALKVMDFSTKDSYMLPNNEILNQTTALFHGNPFSINVLAFDKPVKCDYFNVKSFVILCCLEGDFVIEYSGGTEKAGKGECVLLPAEINEIQYITGNYTQVLEVFIQ